ncbi:MAG: hypothetical protein WBF25_03180 [Terriglobales bacterium]
MSDTGNAEHIIVGFIDPRTERVFHVGCGIAGVPQLRSFPKAVADYISTMEDAPQRVILQTVESAPLFAWVKWSKRFRRDIVTTDWKAFSAQADSLTNSNRVQRAMGLDVPTDAVLHERFHEFDQQNPELFDAMLSTAQNMKAEGRRIFGVSAIIEEMRYANAGTNRTDQFKINASNAAFYARKLQMIDSSLCGLFAMRTSTADDLVLDDGRTWEDFAKEHASELRFVETPDADADLEWSY